MPYSALDYSNDYILDVTESKKTGKKFLFVGDRKPVQLSIRARGRTVVPVSNVLIPVEGTYALETNLQAKYRGKVAISSSTPSTGSASKRIESEHKMLGKLSKQVSEGVQIEGKKDYTKVIKKLDKLMEGLQ